MLPFDDHHNFLDKSFSEQLELNTHLSPRNFYGLPPSPPQSFYIPEGLHDILNLPPTGAVSTTQLPSPPPPAHPPPNAPLNETMLSISEATGNADAGSQSLGRRRFARKDRHSKIYTATGPRDRRMRLSLEVARKFFDLQDTLRFDKASQTVQWLLNKSKVAIRELASVSSQKMCSIGHLSPNSESHNSECEDVASTISDSKGKSTMLRNGTASEAKKPRTKRSPANKSPRKAVPNPTLTKESRAKARERARERTKEKKLMCWANSSTSFNAVEDESGLMQNYQRPQSFEERYLSSHNYQYSMRVSNEKTDHHDLQMAGGSDLTPMLDYGYNHNSTSIAGAAGIFQEWDIERVLLADGQINSRPLMEVFNNKPTA